MAGGAAYVGIDLAWSSGVTGLAGCDRDGRLVSSARVRTDAEIDAWLATHAPAPRVVAVDAPLVVPNETGQRLPEREMARHFGRFGASAHTSNRARFGGDPRGLLLARRHGWSVDPDARPGVGPAVCLEVYPHPALVGLFALPYRLAYKKGTRDQRAPGFATLVRLLEQAPALRPTAYAEWPRLRRLALEPGPGDLDRVEDELDGVLCAHLAWRWEQRPGDLVVHGSLTDGYIVAPPPPTHPPARPTVG